MVTTADDSRLTGLEEQTTENTAAITRLAERTTRLEEQMAENTAVITRLAERTEVNTAAITRLAERTEVNTAAIARLDERTAGHTAAVSRLENKIDKLVWAIIGAGAAIMVALLGGIIGLGVAMLQLISRIAQ